jgi:hypothetical protein
MEMTDTSVDFVQIEDPNKAPIDYEMIKSIYHAPTSTCPNCGYCPHCGRGGYYRTWPYFPQYPWYPWQPSIVWCNSSSVSSCPAQTDIGGV